MTENGLARFVPEPPRQRKPPVILITGLRVEGLPQSVSVLGETDVGELDLKSDQQQISVDFLGLGASLGEKLRYEYRLNDENWTPTTERTVNFANLASDDYRFEVRAQTDDRLFSQPAVFLFKIAVPLWRQWWFIASLSVFLGLAIYLIYRYRLGRLLELERTRTRIATDLHDDIGTNLSKISLLSEVVNLQLANQNLESSRLLNSIAEISRESVSSMSDIVWAINPKRDSVLELVRRMRLHAEESFLEKGASVKFNAPEDGAAIKLSMDVRRELYLIFKEAVSNAARHSDCKNIEVNFFCKSPTTEKALTHRQKRTATVWKICAAAPRRTAEIVQSNRKRDAERL
jgi:nitrate/nitrite-specific signal transduction histidine kinase